MTEEEAIKYLDNIFSDMLIEKEIGQKYTMAIKVLLSHFKYYKNGLQREIESNRRNVLEIIKKDRIIDKMAKYIATLDIDKDTCKYAMNLGKPFCKTDDCDNLNREVDCDTCIKEYFEKK